MQALTLVLTLSAVIVLIFAARGGRLFGSRRADAPPAVPPPSPAPPAPAAEPPPPLISDPLLRRLFELRKGVIDAPAMYSPDDLLALAPFVSLVEGFADPPLETERLLEFWQSDDAIFSWAALCALSRRPRDERVEERLLARINSFHAWSRHFLLRVLEAWNPEDPLLAARVLVRLDDSWSREVHGVTIDQFLHRRAAIAPLTLAGVDVPPGLDRGDLALVLRTQVDPALATPLFEALVEPPFASTPAPVAKTPASDESSPIAVARAPLKEIGQLRKPGSIREERAIGYPTANAAIGRLRSTLLGTPRRSALVVGEAGVGKTSLVRRLAAELSAEGWTIFEAGADQINAGMMFTGSLGQRLQILRKGLRHPKTLWIVPDFHQLLWSGRHVQNPTGILEMLVPAIESDEILILGETRPGALEIVLAERPEIRRLFEVVRIAPPTEPEVAAIIAAWTARCAEQRVQVPIALGSEAMGLARQYLSGQAAPGGVLRLLDGALEAAAERAGTEGTATLGVEDLIAALARLTGLPHEILDERRTLDLDVVRRHFEARVVGQPEAVRCLVERLALLKAGITDPTRPTGVFLFAGPSGTGKTELAKTLADYLFGSPERLVRLDMSELQDPGAFERVLGSGMSTRPPGNSLAERVRRQPFCVVLLDEFEKAHPRVWDLFLQVFDDGRLTDPQGETTDMRQAIIILTSNLGSAISGEAKLGLVGAGEGFSPGTIERAVERAFRPELRNRLDRVVVFRPLTREVMRTILRKELADAFARRGLRRRDWAVELEESAIELLVERGFSPTLGARPLKRALEQLLLTPLAAAIVDRRAPEGDQFLFVRADGDRLAVEFVDPDAPDVAPGPAVAPGHGEMTAIALEARGSRDEVERVHAALAALRARIDEPAWRETKQELLLEAASPDFWKRADRFERLGRAEYLDRIESATRAAASLLERIEGHPAAPRESYPRDVVRRLAQQLHLLEAASREALAEGPRDAFVAIEPMLDDTSPAAPAREFAGRLAAMYASWARARGMRFAQLETPDGSREPRYLIAIAGFAAYALLEPEEGLHVLEDDEPGGRTVRRTTVRVRVLPQPAEPARDGAPGLLRQARERLALRPAATNMVARRYRDGASPLVRDTVRGWRTKHIDRVLGGDFDLIQARE